LLVVANNHAAVPEVIREPGTMVGWKRIVVTVGERIGKHHMTYGQGMSAELVAMSTIAAADGLGMPVSTTHVLNSAVAGTMVANKSGQKGGWNRSSGFLF
ncbi:inorganic phosphate transporter, partial [Klebsiella pneumoniae]